MKTAKELVFLTRTLVFGIHLLCAFHLSSVKTEPLSLSGKRVLLKEVFHTLQPRLLKMIEGDRGWFMEAAMNTVSEGGPSVVSVPGLA